MAAKNIRDSAIQSIENVYDYTNKPEFTDQPISELQLRLDYLHESFNRFTVNHQELLNRAINQGDQDDERDQKELFGRIEENYFEIRRRLQERLAQINQTNQHPIEDDDNESEQGQFDNNDSHSENNRAISPSPNDNNTSLIGSLQSSNYPSQHMQPQVEMTQFGQLVQQMCMSMANKKENTWGKFDGDLSKWQGFHDAFKAAVHDDDLIAPAFKLQFLKSSLEGRAAREFGEWPGGNDNYQLAWQWLIEQNKQDYATSKTILFRLLSFTRIERASSSAIQKLCTITQNVIRQLEAMKFPVKHYNMIIVHIVHDKLDPETSKDWELNRKSENPTVDEITDFLRLRARALFNSQCNDKKDCKEQRKRPSYDKELNHQNKRAKSSYQSSANDKEKKTDSGQCKFCTEKHWLNQCKQFRKLKLNERKSTVRELKVCFNCFSSSHQVKDCTWRACSHCQKMHHVLLCDQNPYNKSVNAVQTKQKSKRDVKKEKKQPNPPKSS